MEMICINCPMGCIMEVTKQGDEYVVKGNLCPKGKKYAQKECTYPTRVVTSSVYVDQGIFNVVPVKTATDIPKNKIFDVLQVLKNIRVKAPVHIGDIIVENVEGTGVNIIATKEVPLYGTQSI